MSARKLISIDDYLASSYEPHCDFVDGHIEERNVGEWNHAKLRLKVGSYLLAHCGATGIQVVTGLRIRVAPKRIRIPDICPYLSDPGERVPATPPFLCIEVLSPEDRMSRMEVRINDYLAMGVPYVWVARSGNPASVHREADGRSAGIQERHA